MRKSFGVLLKQSLRHCLPAVAILVSIASLPASAENAPAMGGSGAFSKERAWSDGVNFKFEAECVTAFPRLCVLIDSDANPDTGYTVNGIGADYMIDGRILHHWSSSSGTNWSLWTTGFPLANQSTPSPHRYMFSVPLQSIGSPPYAGVSFIAIDATGKLIIDPVVTKFVQGASSGSGGGSSGGGVYSPPIQPGPNGFADEQASDDGGNFYFRATCAVPYPHFQVLIDTRTASAGGYGVRGIVPDYMIQDDKLYHYVKSAVGDPIWSAGDQVVVRSSPGPNMFEFSVPLSAIGSPASAKVILQAVNASGNTITDPTLVTFVRGSQPHVGGNGPSPVDDSEAGWIFSGMVEVDDDQCKGGMQHAGGASTYAAYTFNGSGVDIYATTGPSIDAGSRTHKLGRMRILVDGKPDGEYSLFQTSVTYQSKVYSVTGLALGNHLLQLEAVSGWIDVDYIRVSTDGPSAVAGNMPQ